MNRFHSTGGKSAGFPPEVTVRKALAQQRRRQILRCLREVREDRTEEHERPVPPMPEKLPRATQTLVRRLASNTAFSPALRHKFYGNDPGEGLCLQCCVPATAEHLVWDCQCYALFRARTLDTLPEDIRPTTYFDWVLPLTRNITTLTLLWTSLAAFVYADEGPRGVLVELEVNVVGAEVASEAEHVVRGAGCSAGSGGDEHEHVRGGECDVP
ncbi:uncharacterized protein LOC144164791 [Haemaphysalis longicornis]